ncbi:hypothetical protein CgunFtcFv8_000489 [Champsocephalus gunnari]|uniref:Transmembrane protein 201 n=1 Tax=Champsocephalus gunnari TaxID=52237 RepID=A0AAN8HPW6_CHAGU|nr:hypothetical protein CgunFtcFv8_000489 [Champsocephalus gunnari]
MEAFTQLLLEYPEFMYSGVGATASVAVGALIYKLATRKKPTHADVNCWFCNQNYVVPFGNRNCWDCPNCDQYNGFQENGDYNKPIPAQFMENLNHGVSGSLPSTPKTQQSVSSQMLLCRKCNKNQTFVIKQLASFIARNDDNYDEEIEAFKHHLEQTYKLCKPCQTAVEYYIKFQNRHLRTVLLNHPLRRSGETEKGFVKSSHAVSSPMKVILLRALTFFICAFLVATSLCALPYQHTSLGDPQILSVGAIPPKLAPNNESAPNNDSSGGVPLWQDLLELLPDEAIDKAKLVWQHGKNNQLAIVCVGLLTCLTAIFLAGPVRLRRIDAVASSALLLLWQRASHWVQGEPDIEDTLQAALQPPPSAASPLLSPELVDSFVPTLPPNFSKLLNRQQSPRERKASPSSLPGRLSRALSLGTIPPLTRTDSGYLFSGSRPASHYKDSPPSDYFSLISGSRPSSPGPSPAPSVAGSVTSSSGSARLRRPLISPARLNISGRQLRLFSGEQEATLMSPSVSSSHFHFNSASSIYSGCLSPDVSPFQSQNDLSSLFRDGSVIEEEEKQGSSSDSSACIVGTTTQGPENGTPPKGFIRRLIWPGLLMVSLTSNLVFASVYIYLNWR